MKKKFKFFETDFKLQQNVLGKTLTKEALILCGGFGTRFRAVSESPKILADFRGKKFIDYLFEFLFEYGIDFVYLATNYRSQEIENYLEEKKLQRYSIIKEDEVLGTGGAIVNALQYIEGDSFIVLNGDTFFNGSLPESFFESEPGTIKLGISRISKNERFGDFKIENGKLIISRGSSQNPILDSDVFCGIALFAKFKFVSSLKVPFSMERLLLELAEDYNISLNQIDADFLDFGIPEDYRRLQLLT